MISCSCHSNPFQTSVSGMSELCEEGGLEDELMVFFIEEYDEFGVIKEEDSVTRLFLFVSCMGRDSRV